MRILFIFLFFAVFKLFGQDSKNIELLDNWVGKDLKSTVLNVPYNEVWGFVHKEQEYAVIGSTEGTHFFKISDQNKLVEIDSVTGRYSNALVVHRDFKTYKNYLYGVCDEGNSSLQIIDLSYLPDSVHLVADIEPEFGRVHNIFIDSSSALLYCFSQRSFLNNVPISSNAMRVFSLANPEQPIHLWDGPSDIPEVHDGYIRNNKAILNCGFDGLRRYDFSNPSSPIFEQNIPFYQEQGYNHQGWLNPAGDVYIFGDETSGKKLKKCTVDANGEIKIENYFGSFFAENSVPHNIMLDDKFAYVAYYNYGLRIYDYSGAGVREIAHYDTYTLESSFKMNGAWGIYSQLPSGRILVSDRTFGLFLFGFNRSVFENKNNSTVQLYPNPVSKNETLTLAINDILETAGFSIKIADTFGRSVFEKDYFKTSYAEISATFSAGTYFLEVRYEKNQETVKHNQKIIIY